MFKRINILLTGPICKCAEQALEWGIHLDVGNYEGLKFSDASLLITCKTCSTQIRVPSKTFVATFMLDEPYPGKPKPPPEPKPKDPPSGRDLN